MAEDRMLSDEILLGLINKNSGGGGGTNNYNDLSNQPQINGNTLTGNKTASDLGLVAAENGKSLSTNDYTDADKAIVGGVTAALTGKQDALTAGDYIALDGNAISVKRTLDVPLIRYEFISGAYPNMTIKKYVNEVFDSENTYEFTGTAWNRNIDGFFTLYSERAESWTPIWRIALIKDSNEPEHEAGYATSWNVQSTYDFSYSFNSIDVSGQKLIIKSEMDTALSGKQDTLTFDDAPTANSSNPVKSGGIYDALALKQNATDNSLETTDKTIVGAINEHEGDVNSLKSGLINVETDVEELQAYTGYSTTDIIGIEVDYVNKSFRRLGAAVGKNGGSDFDSFSMFGGRRRCNVADDGTISKYYGDTGYAEDGSNGQVMVYQPKFYYKVVPLKLEKQSTGKGYHIRKAAYYVTATPMKGFKVHPAFVNASGNEVDYILVGASKGCIYDVSESTYILDDAQVMDNTADKFSSIFGVKPASGLTQDLTRPKIEQMCQNRGANWHELNVQMASMTQLLMLIEYGKFDMQRAIGKGVVDITDNSSYNCGATSGSTAALGNASGRATSTTIVTNTSTTYTDDGKTSVTYRGEEDPYGDMWEFVMGMNIYGNGSMNGGEPYICSDYNYAESKNTDNYKGAGFTVANSDGYVNAWGYGSEDFDWLFIASEVGGSDALPVGDYLWKAANLNGYRIALLGADWHNSWWAGGFCWALHGGVGHRLRAFAGRLAYIPA